MTHQPNPAHDAEEIWIVKRIVEESYQVIALSKQTAIDKVNINGSPFAVKVIKEKAIKIRPNGKFNKRSSP